MIALQEIFDEVHARYIINSLELIYPYYGRQGSGGLLALHNGLLVLSKFPIKKTVFHPFKATTWLERIFASKGFLEVVVELEDEGLLTVLNVHLASGSVNPESARLDTVRAEEMTEVLSVAEAAQRDGQVPIIIGDLNAAATLCPKSYNMLINSGWRDALREAKTLWAGKLRDDLGVARIHGAQNSSPLGTPGTFISDFKSRCNHNFDRDRDRDQKSLMRHAMEMDETFEGRLTDGRLTDGGSTDQRRADTIIRQEIELRSVKISIEEDEYETSGCRVGSNEGASAQDRGTEKDRGIESETAEGYTSTMAPQSHESVCITTTDASASVRTPDIDPSCDPSRGPSKGPSRGKFGRRKDRLEEAPNTEALSTDITNHEIFWTWDPKNPLNVLGPHSSCHGLRCDHVFLPCASLAGFLQNFSVRSAEILFDQPRVLASSTWFRSLLFLLIGRCCSQASGSSGPLLVTLSDHYALKVSLFRSAG